MASKPLSPKAQQLILAAIIALYAVLAFCYALTRVYSYNAASMDLGAYLQVLGSIVDTGVPYATFHPIDDREFHWFGFHFTPLLYPIAAIYAIAPSIPMLTAIHCGLIGLSGALVFSAAKHLGLGARASLVATAAYLFNPFTMNSGIWGFQEPTIAAPIVALAVWALAAKRFSWLCIASALLLLTKEHYGLSVAGFGLLWWWQNKDKKGFALAAAGVLAAVLVLFVIMPYFRGNYANPMLTEGTRVDRYSWLFSPSEWKNILGALGIDNLKYVFLLFATLGFLPLGGLVWFLAASADLAIIVLAQNGLFRSIACSYGLPMMPAITMAACAGYLYVQRTGYRRPVLGFAAFAAIAYSYMLSSLPLPFASNTFELPAKPLLSMPEKDAKIVADIKALVPAGSPLRAQGSIGLFFAEYPYTMHSRAGEGKPYFFAMRLESPRQYSLLAISAASTQVFIMTAAQLLSRSEVKIIYWNKPWVVLSLGEGTDIPGARQEVRKALEDLSDQQEAIYNHLKSFER